MEEEIKESERMVKEQGVIYGHRYDLYTIEDIQKISNYEFLSDMLANMIPAGQPTTEEESHTVLKCAVANKRLRWTSCRSLGHCTRQTTFTKAAYGRSVNNRHEIA